MFMNHRLLTNQVQRIVHHKEMEQISPNHVAKAMFFARP